MTALLSPDLGRVVDAWSAAELAGDAPALDALLHSRFLFAGPFGFLLDRDQWQARFTSGDLRFSSFAFTVDAPAREFGDTALVVGTRVQDGTHQGNPIGGAFRATIVLARDPRWLIAGMHLSLRQPPGPPAGGAEGMEADR